MATVIEAIGSTSLVANGSNYFLEPKGGSAVELRYQGAPVVAGQFTLSGGTWVPIGAELTANGYEVAWKVKGANEFTVWYTDKSGNYLSNVGVLSGTSATLESFETSFQQDLNGDGLIGIARVIEAIGSTSLVANGSNYFLEPKGGSAVELRYQGAPVVAGQFTLSGGTWVPIGAELTANGYEVAWKVKGANEFTVWYTDKSGNFLSNVGVLSGTSATLESFETSFQQDLNGDGLIGIAQVIEAIGSTSLVANGSNYFLEPKSGSAVELRYQGAPVVAGQFTLSGGTWVPIGAELTANGYEVAWKVKGANEFTVWYTDKSGNFLSNVGVLSGTSLTLESFETSFQQDLNGDGLIGIAQVIEAIGSTSLVANGSNYFLEPKGGSAVELRYQGAPVVAGQFTLSGGTWVPIGAELTANGYEVAWKVKGANEFTVWYTDKSGNFLSNVGVLSGTSATLESFETSFQQDLNGDGIVGVPGQASSPHFVYEGVDSNGVQLYDVTWDTLGSHPFAVRVLAPDHPSTKYPHSFLFALPVEAGLAQSTYGSGLDQLRQLDAQNQYNATIVEPIFPIDSWYADNPLNPTIDFETFTATLLPGWIDSNFGAGGKAENLLIGFSKSGYGALDLLFKHSSIFDAAAAWDFPADMSTYDAFGSSSSGDYGTNANFQNNYRLTGTFVDSWKAPFTTEDRIWISGYNASETSVADFDALLTSHGVLHTLSPQTLDPHTWSGGWLSNAVAGLYGLEQQINGGGSNAVSKSLTTSSTASNEATSANSALLLTQAIASFGSSSAATNDAATLIGAEPQQLTLAASFNSHAPHV